MAAQEATGELALWTHSDSEAGAAIESSLRGQKFRSIAVSGNRVAAVTDANNGRVSWFPAYQGWSSVKQKEEKSTEGKSDAEPQDELEQPQQPGTEEERVEEALMNQLGRGRPSDIALGKEHVLVASDDGRVFSWGRGEDGQLGLPHALGTDMPAEVKALSARGVVLVSAGRAHSAAVTHDGGLYTWGANNYGQTGLGNGMPWSSVLVPRFVNAFLGVPVSIVSCGHNFTACVTGVGEVWTWGEGGSGQLGIGKTTTKCTSPQLAAGLNLTSDGIGFSTVSCGWGHCLAVSRTTGQLYSWGLNSHGQLGLGDVQKRTTPTQVVVNAEDQQSGGSTMVLFEDCNAGDNNSVALTKDVRCLWAWGSKGRCHNGNNEQHVLMPQHVASTKVSGYGVGLVACGNRITAAFSPTAVRQISPSAGPTDGGSEIHVICDGVWHSDKILVRFSAILNGDDDEEECVEIEAGTYDAALGAIVCRTPPWSLDEPVLVEVTVNGFDFTSDNLTYTFYNPPTVHGSWPPYGFVDVPTPLTVYGTSFVNSTDLSVRFRSLAPEGLEDNSESSENTDQIDQIVRGRFIGKGEIQCIAPILNVNETTECAVDVAINGVDFTDAGVVFTFHGFQPLTCAPLCGPQKGGNQVTIALESDAAKNIDEDGLRIKMDFGGQREVEVPCKVRGQNLVFKTPKMDGKHKKSKFPKFEFVPPVTEEDSTVSSGSKPKEASTIVASSETIGSGEEPLPWPKDVGSCVGTIMLSVNGGATYRALPFEFTAYKSAPSVLECSHNIAMSVGGLEVELGMKGTLTCYPSFGDAGTMEEGEGKEGGDGGDGGEGGEGGEEEAKEAGEQGAKEAGKEGGEEKSDGFGLGLKDMGSMPAAPSTNWLFPSNNIKIKFKGRSDTGSIDTVVEGIYDEQTGSISCAVPSMPAAIEWVNYMKEEQAKVAAGLEEDSKEEDPEGEEDESDQFVPPVRPDVMDVEVYLAMDGTTFEKISTLSMMPPPAFESIVTEEGGATPGSAIRIVGSGFGAIGAAVKVQVDHVSSGTDFTMTGIIEQNEGKGEGETIDSVVFTAPKDIQLKSGEQDGISNQCIAEISVDGSTMTDWQMTFAMVPGEEE